MVYLLSLMMQLQVGLARGTLKPGLVGEVRPRRTFTNNVVRILTSSLLYQLQVDCVHVVRSTCEVGCAEEEGPD